MNDNPYEPPKIESDAPEHPPSLTVGGVPGLRGRYRVEWSFIAVLVLATLAFHAFPFLIELLAQMFPRLVPR